MKKILLIILDGWGIAPPGPGNAPSQANIPFIRNIERYYLATTLHASGINIGLPWWEEGNSEVGHLTIGTGQVIYHYLPRIITAIQDGLFFQKEAFLGVAQQVKKNHSRLHLMGLISSGGIHSYIDHFYALLDFCQQQGIEKVYLHMFSDGRDTPPKEAVTFLPTILQRLQAQELGKIASIHGRSFAMDRDKNWDRIKRSYECITQGKGKEAKDPINYLKESYERGITDEYIEPAIFDKEGIVKPGDAVIFFNFREDRAKQLTQAFLDENFKGFEREKIENLYFASMTRYFDHPGLHVAFEPPKIGITLAEVFAKNNLLQFRIAETEKYAHVTYFFNGLREEPFKGEERKLIPSQGGPHYDKKPEMQAYHICEEVLNRIKSQKYHFILINFANPDMVGHTANIQAAIKAAEVLDECLSKIVPRALENKYTTLISGDHGNFEEMLNPRTAEVMAEHSSNPVPFYLVDPELKKSISREKDLSRMDKAGGFLFDIAPTILEYLGIKKPPEMVGTSLLFLLRE